ncbi:MAG: sigma-70 family RNA polymerase sigma factor [Dehalococcoidia bacterium]|nr:sigma-70 family RNA polymerase sigma factor [Dehalococcoidia bacterium]
MDEQTVTGTWQADAGGEGLQPQLEPYRRELTAYCYRMLGSAFEAEDAVQDTFLRAWKSYDRFEGRSSLRTWLYRIATNVCLNMVTGSQRRARSMDLGPSGTAESPLGERLPEERWILPVPDTRVLPDSGDPVDIVATRDSVRLAFVAALHRLPPRQRAVLILREVLDWRATEVAELLDTTVASVNSALQRARATLSQRDVSGTAPSEVTDEHDRELLARYVEAFERYDLDALTSLLHEDATWSMPPFPLWLETHLDIRRFCLGTGITCKDSRLVPVSANGMPAFAQYKPAEDGGFTPWALQVLEIAGGRIAGVTFFLDTPRLFPLFDLPLHLDP